MALTTRLYATTATAVTGSWSSAANATGSTASTYAGFLSSTRSQSASIRLSGYNFSSAVSADATINGVSALVKHYQTATAPYTSVTLQLFSGTTAIGSAVTLTLNATSTFSQTVTLPAPTADQLSSLNVLYTVNRGNSTTSSTANLDYIGLVVDYTAPVTTGPYPAIGLKDTFDAQDNSKWSFGAGAAVSGGRLVLTPNTGYTAGVRSVAAQDLTNKCVFAELVQRPNNVNSVATFMKLYRSTGTDSTDAIGFDIVGTNLEANRDVGGTRTVVGSVPYNATNHRWLRFRHQNGQFFWDVSAAGENWVELFSWTPTWTVTSMIHMLSSGYWDTAQTNVGTAIWDNANINPALVTVPDVSVGLDQPDQVVNTVFTRTATNSGAAATSHEWKITVGPAGVNTVIGTTSTLSWTPTVVGTYTILYKATNASGFSNDSLDIRVINAGQIVPPVMGDWKTVFYDDFEGTSINTTNWAVHNGKTQNGITTSSANVRVADSVLYLKTPSTTSGAQVTTFQVDGVGKATGYVMPIGGYVEAMMWFPGDGVDQWYNWPAFWTVTPTNWPVGGEIDIAEAHTNGQPSINYHYGTNATTGHVSVNRLPTIPGYYGDGWYRFGMHRTSTEARVYWNGQLAQVIPTQDSGAAHSLVFTSGYGTPASLGAELRIDWVRAWEPGIETVPSTPVKVRIGGVWVDPKVRKTGSWVTTAVKSRKSGSWV